MKIPPKKGGVGGEGGSSGSRLNAHSMVVTPRLTPDLKVPPLGVLLYIGGGFFTLFWSFFGFFDPFFGFFGIFDPNLAFLGGF